jgi:hypothetical protein
VRYESRLLLRTELKDHFSWVYQASLKELADLELRKSQHKQISMFYSIVQYLLNFGTPKDISETIHSYHEFLNGFK